MSLSVSCASAGDCSAVGSYLDSAGAFHGLLVGESGGSWGTAIEPTPPANAASNPRVSLRSVSCASAGECTAVGSYSTPGGRQGLAVGESGGSWGTATELTPPAQAPSNPDASLDSVSCASPGDCSAVGSYTRSGGDTHGLLVSESGGSWGTSIEPTLPANAAGNPRVSLWSVSCASAGGCSAVGGYFDTAGATIQGLLVGTAASKAASVGLSFNAPAGAAAGSAVPASSLTAALSGGASPGGAVTFRVFGPQPSPPGSCTTGGATVGSASVAGNGDYHPADGFTPPSAGDYWWYASYGGDTNNNPATSACGAGMPETVVTPASVGLSFSAPAGAVAGSGAGMPDTIVKARNTTAASLALLRALKPTGHGASIRALLRAHGFTFFVTAPTAATLTITWYQLPRSATLARSKHPKPRLVAEATKTLHAGTRTPIKLKLTTPGIRLLRHTKRIRLTEKAIFAPSGQKPTTASRKIKLSS